MRIVIYDSGFGLIPFYQTLLQHKIYHTYFLEMEEEMFPLGEKSEKELIKYADKKIEECIGLEAEVELDYNNLETFKYYCKKNDIYIKDYEYSEKIICKIQLEECSKERLIADFNTKKVNLIKLKFLSKKLIEKSIIN